MTDTPLNRLATLLDADMRAVNAAILKRMSSDIPLIPQIAAYLIAAGGKRIRPLLCLAAAMACGKTDKVVGLSAAVEFIHTATLLHDDVVDGSTQRRGKDAANLVFGNQASVLVGDFLFARAFELMVETDDIRILSSLATASRTIAEGEVLQLSLIGNLDMTLEQYNQVIGAKTAVLFAAAAESGALSAGASDADVAAMRTYGYHLGMAFQMADDLGDYAGTIAGKNAGDDFAEGKLTLPVLLALQSATQEERAFWQRVLVDKDQELDDFAKAKDILNSHHAIAKATTMAQKTANDAQTALRSLAPSPVLETLQHLPEFVVSRV